MEEKQRKNSGNHPVISVIIPVHNAEKTLEAAVRSVLRQTVRNLLPLEAILVDDGSDDASSRLCDALAAGSGADAVGKPNSTGGRTAADPSHCMPDDIPDGKENGSAQKENPALQPVFLQVIHMRDEGVSEARNRGISAAGGRFLTFLDADDAMEPEMLECLYALHERTGAQICGCGFRSVTPEEAAEYEKAADANGKGRADREPAGGKQAGQAEARREEQTSQEAEGGGEPQIFTGTDIVRDAILLRDTRVWSKLFTREAIGDRRFRKGLTIGEDMLFVVSLIEEGTRYALVKEEKLYRYTVNPKGAMERPFTPSYMDQIRCWEEAGKLLEKNLPEVLKDPEAAARLGTLQMVSDVLTASKIAKLPAKERERYEDEFQLCRKKLALHRRVPGAAAGLSWDYRIKSALLERLPGIYRRLYE